MYIIEFDDLEVKPDPHDPARRIGQVRIMEKTGRGCADREAGGGPAEDCWRGIIPRRPSASTWPATRPGRTRSGRGGEAHCKVLYAYDPGKRPLTMIECVVIPRDEKKMLDFISYMEEVFEEEQVVAGTHGHAGDCNFHLYLLLNLTQTAGPERLINVMTKITQKVTELGGSMSGEHADGRTRGVILPHVFGLGLFDLFVEIKDLMDPRAILHPGVKIIREARDKDLHQAIEELVGHRRRRTASSTWPGSRTIPTSTRASAPSAPSAPTSARSSAELPEEFAARTEAAPTFKRALAVALESRCRTWTRSGRTRCSKRSSTSACSAASARASAPPTPACGTWWPRCERKSAARSSPRPSSR